MKTLQINIDSKYVKSQSIVLCGGKTSKICRIEIGDSSGSHPHL